MSAVMRKAVTEIIAKLKKLPEPGKKTGSFWDFMRSKLMEEGEWEQKHIKVIENEIENYLSKVDKKTVSEIWRATPAGEEKYDDDIKVEDKEMKTDIIDEMIGQVMDRMDENYSSRDSYFPPSAEAFVATEKKSDAGSDEDELEPDNLTDEDIDLDEDIFNEDVDDDEEYKF